MMAASIFTNHERRASLECQRSVDADVPVSVAWTYMTNVSNWKRSARSVLAGWTVRGGVARNHADARAARARVGDSRHCACRAYTIESPLPEEVLLRFVWRFEEVSARRTRLTQRIEVCGKNAATYVDESEPASNPTSSRACGELRTGWPAPIYLARETRLFAPYPRPESRSDDCPLTSRGT